MNKRRATQPAASPTPAPLAVYATAKPLRREPPLWTSSLTSKPIGCGWESELPRPRDDRVRPPLFSTINLLLGTWEPGRYPEIGRAHV